MKKVIYGLYEKRTLSCYEGGNDTYESLLGCAATHSELRDRWNTIQDAERNDILAKNKHKSYLNSVPPNMPDSVSKITFAGGTGGGYARVRYEVSIRPIDQWDDA